MGDFNDVSKAFSNGKDSIAVRNYTGGILGGVFLDTKDYPPGQKTIPVLTIIERNTATGVCRPLAINAQGNYKVGSDSTLKPADGFEIIGVTVTTVMTDRPAVGVMNSGEINEKAMSFVSGTGNASTGASLAIAKAALKTALPTLILNHD